MHKVKLLIALTPWQTRAVYIVFIMLLGMVDSDYIILRGIYHLVTNINNLATRRRAKSCNSLVKRNIWFMNRKGTTKIRKSINITRFLPIRWPICLCYETFFRWAGFEPATLASGGIFLYFRLVVHYLKGSQDRTQPSTESKLFNLRISFLTTLFNVFYWIFCGPSIESIFLL